MTKKFAKVSNARAKLKFNRIFSERRSPCRCSLLNRTPRITANE